MYQENRRCSYLGEVGDALQGTYKVTCFLKESPSVLLPSLLPFHFNWTRRESIIWADTTSTLEIVPFSVNGRESYGYRIYYGGKGAAAGSLSRLLERFLGMYEITYSALEWIAETSYSQSKLIQLAEDASFEKTSMFGLYEHNNVGVVLLPSQQIHLQVRNQRITNRNFRQHMDRIITTQKAFQSEPLDLFSFLEEVDYA